MKDKALLVVDVQNDFVTGSLGSEYANKVVVPNVVKLIEEFGEDSFVTLDTHNPDYLETFEGKKLPVEHCIIHTPGHKLVPEVEKAFEKIFSNNLAALVLHIILKETFGADQEELVDSFEDYKEIHICGLCTDICVVSNALILRALFPDKTIVVHADACGGTSKEAHEAALTVMKSCQIDIV